MRVVVDCNVVVFAGLTDKGTCHKALIHIFESFELIVTDAILNEYKEVAVRAKFYKYRKILFGLVELIEQFATKIADKIISSISLPDEKDLIYIYAAKKQKLTNVL